MIAHERERLAAYLDRELEPGAQREVEAHLSVCAECAGRLEELRAVDRWTRQLDLAVPDGYFDGFAKRVRRRLEHPPAEATRRTARRPAWAWAAAAALAVAALAPLTWREWSQAPEAQTAGAESASRQPPSGARGGSDSRPASVGATAPAARPAPRPSGPAARAFSAPPPEPLPRDEPWLSGQRPAALPAEAAGEPGSPASPATPPVEEAVVASAGAVTREAEAFEDEPTSPGEGVADAARAKTEGSRAREAKARRAAPAPPAGAAPARGRAAGLAASGFSATESAGAAGAAFARLAAREPRSPGEWRAARRAWREFASDYAASPLADEARVRAIEAVAAAFAASGAEADLALLQGEAVEYLAREDARQADRVRRCLGAAEAGR